MVVAATAGMKGDSEKDRVLTEARALVVRDYLVKNFKLDDARIKTLGLGKAETGGGETKVDILVYPVEVIGPPSAAPGGRFALKDGRTPLPPCVDGSDGHEPISEIPGIGHLRQISKRGNGMEANVLSMEAE